MSRPALLDFCGARGRISLGDVLELGPRWAVQEKIDGSLAHVYLDGRGRIERLLSRSGRPFGAELVGHLVGAFVGWPGAVLVGEFEVWSEAANRAAEERGYRVVHLFDMVRGEGGRYLGREPYRVRRDALWRSQSWACQERGRGAFELDAAGHAHDRSGRFCAPVPRDWRLAPVVAQAAPAHAQALYERASVGEAEGVVAVALDAPIGARRAKLKCKPGSEREAVVVAADRKAAILEWRGIRFSVSARAKGIELAPGAVVSFRHEGFYEASNVPRFARLTRRRPDLEGARP